MIAVAAAGTLCAAGCYDPPVRESLHVRIDSEGAIRARVETTFRRSSDPTRQEIEAIRQALDLYALRRDPWLRGLARAGATDIRHELEGSEEAPVAIVREARLPELASLTEVLPDRIANFRLERDDVAGTVTLRVTHIDLPESIRENRRALDREIDRQAGAAYRFSESHCDLYDYLAEHPGRRADLLQALMNDEAIEGLLSPQETVLIARLEEQLEALSGASPEQEGPREPEGAEQEKRERASLAAMRFGAFDHELCVELPAEAVGWVGMTPTRDQEHPNTYCAERVDLDAVILETAFPRADPPLLQDDLPADAESLVRLPFTCVRQAGPVEIRRILWERILPRESYALTWATRSTD